MYIFAAYTNQCNTPPKAKLLSYFNYFYLLCLLNCLINFLTLLTYLLTFFTYFNLLCLLICLFNFLTFGIGRIFWLPVI